MKQLHGARSFAPPNLYITQAFDEVMGQISGYRVGIEAASRRYPSDFAVVEKPLQQHPADFNFVCESFMTCFVKRNGRWHIDSLINQRFYKIEYSRQAQQCHSILAPCFMRNGQSA
jgi:hypothetical protein